MEHFGSPSESLTLSEFGNNSSMVEAQIDQFVVGILGPNVNRKDLETLVVQQQVSDIVRANNDLIALKQFRISSEKAYKDKELAAIRRKEIYEPLTNALTHVEILEERLGRRDELIEQLRRQIIMLNIEKKESDEIITQKTYHLAHHDSIEKVKAEKLKDEIVLLERKAEADALMIVKCRKTMKTQQDKIKQLHQLNEKIEFQYKEKIKRLEMDKESLNSLADSKDAKIEQLIEARDFLNQHHQDLQEAMEDCMAQLKEAKRVTAEQAETLATMEGESSILARNWKETLDLYNEKNEECIILTEKNADLQARYDKLVLDMDRMVEFGFKEAPVGRTASEDERDREEEDFQPRSRANSSMRKKRPSRNKSMSMSIRQSIGSREGGTRDSRAQSEDEESGSEQQKDVILNSIREAQVAVAVAELKEQQQAQLKGLFAQRKADQDAIAEELRKASAAMRVREQLEATIADLTAKWNEEKAARETLLKASQEAAQAAEARRKEESINLHQKLHKHERQFHTLNEMFTLETAKVQRLEAELDHITRQHESTLEAHLQQVDQLKEENEQLTVQSSIRDTNLVRPISGQFIDLSTGGSPEHVVDSSGHNTRSGSRNQREAMDDELFNDSGVLSRQGSHHGDDSVDGDDKGDGAAGDEQEEIDDAAADAEYDMFAYMLSWKNVQLNSKGTETELEEPTLYAEAECQFDLNEAFPSRLTDRQVQTAAMEATVESYLDVLYTDLVMLSRRTVPNVGVLGNESDKFVVQSHGFPVTPAVPLGSVAKPVLQPPVAAATTATATPVQEPNVIRKSIVIPSSNRPLSPKTPSVASTRPTSPSRPPSPKQPTATTTTTAAVTNAATTAPSPTTVPALNNTEMPTPLAGPVDEALASFLGSESDVIFRHRRAINYLASLNDIRNLAVRDLNRLPVGGTLNSRLLIRSVDIFLQTLHTLLSSATNEPATPKTAENSDYAELIRAIDAENEEYDDEIGEGYRDGVEAAITERLEHPVMLEERPLSVHKPRSSQLGDTFKLTQTVLTTAETAAGARRGLLSPKTVIPKPKVNRTYMNRANSPRKSVVDVDGVLERTHQLEAARSAQNSPERMRHNSDSEAVESGDDLISSPARESEDEQYASDYGADAKERNAIAINRYYNFNREKSFIENKMRAEAANVPGTQFTLVDLEPKPTVPQDGEDDLTIRSPVLEAAEAHLEETTAAASSLGAAEAIPGAEHVSKPRGPLGPSRYKFKSMMRSTSSNASEADSDYIDYTRLKFKPFSESNNAYNNDKTLTMRPASRSLKPAVPRARTAGAAPFRKSSRIAEHQESVSSGSGGREGGGGGLPSIDQYHSSTVASIPSASLEKDSSTFAGLAHYSSSAGGAGVGGIAERSIALSDTSSFYFNYSEDETDHKHFPVSGRFRSNNKSPPRDRRVRTAPMTAPDGNISLSAQPMQLGASPRQQKKNSISSKSDVAATASGGGSSMESSLLSAPVIPAIPASLEESLSLLDISMHLAPPLPGTHLMTSTQVKSKLQKLHTTAQNNINGVDMLLVGSPANAEAVTYVKPPGSAPHVVTRPSSGSSTTRPSPRVKVMSTSAAPVAINMPTTYFGGSTLGGVENSHANDRDTNRLDLSSANRTSRQ